MNKKNKILKDSKQINDMKILRKKQKLLREYKRYMRNNKNEIK